MGEATTQRAVVAGFAIFFDGADAGLPASQYAEFQARGGSRRTGYRTGYVFDGRGPYFVHVNAIEFTVAVTPYVPRQTHAVGRDTTEAQLLDLLGEDTDLAWDADAVTTLTRILPITFRNVRWVNPQLSLRPPGPADAVYVDVVAPGFRVENLSVAGVLPWEWNQAHRGTCDVFHVHDGGSLVCRPVGPAGGVTASTIDRFCYVSSGHAGVVLQDPVLTDLREYALYQNGGDAGVSCFRARVDAHGNEPFFRVIDNPRDAVRTANVYIGHSQMRRRAPEPVGKDGITPRDCLRFAADSNTLHRCQIRSGQDEQGVADGGSDPDDILIAYNTVHDSYLDHKRGRGLSKRIHVIRNTFHTPYARPPIMFAGTHDSAVTDNVWIGGDAQWRPQRANENAGLTLFGNGNDPNAVVRARIAALDAELSGLATTAAELRGRQRRLRTDRAGLVARLI